MTRPKETNHMAMDWLRGAGYNAGFMFENNDPNYGAMYIIVYL